MKRIISFISVFALLLTSCTGEQGPPGFDGQDGGIFVAQSFERTIDFLPEFGYEEFIQIPLTIELLETDMTLAYILWEQEAMMYGDLFLKSFIQIMAHNFNIIMIIVLMKSAYL